MGDLESISTHRRTQGGPSPPPLRIQKLFFLVNAVFFQTLHRAIINKKIAGGGRILLFWCIFQFDVNFEVKKSSAAGMTQFDNKKYKLLTEYGGIFFRPPSTQIQCKFFSGIFF